MKKSETAILIQNLQSKYLREISKYSLQKLADKFNVSLNTTSDVTLLFDYIRRSLFRVVMSDTKFLSLPILKHYHTIDGHYFVFDITDSAMCPYSSEKAPIYKAIQVGNGSYGFTHLYGINYNVIDSELYKTLSDIIPLLKKYTQAMDIPLIS